VSCGARLRHPKEFRDVMAEQSMGMSPVTCGRVGAVIAIALYGLAVVVVLPQQVQASPMPFVVGAVFAALAGRFIGRAIAHVANDTSV
jgi:hypothetical protein